MTKVKIHESWKNVLEDEFSKTYMEDLRAFLKKEIESGKKIFPPMNKIFNAFNLTPLTNVKIVLVGQDPYHGVGQANGLAFSVEKDTKIPPSLVNIYKELGRDINLPPPNHGDLTFWAKQGVFLLNTTLTVEQSKPLSHQHYGWGEFTDKVINVISEHLENIVFILWGSFAQSKKSLIDSKKHFILTAPHPSPLSAHRGFFGSKPFSQTNNFLQSKQIDRINW